MNQAHLGVIVSKGINTWIGVMRGIRDRSIKAIIYSMYWRLFETSHPDQVTTEVPLYPQNAPASQIKFSTKGANQRNADSNSQANKIPIHIFHTDMYAQLHPMATA